MVLFKSPHPHLSIPDRLTTWQWAFEDKEFSPTEYASPRNVGGYINAVTKERLDLFEVKTKATQLSTALIRHYGLQAGDTVSLFSTNTIWYPIAMWATVRAGGRVNGASPAYNAEEMAYALKTAESKFLFTLPTSLKVAMEAAESVGLPKKHIFLLEGRHPDFLSLDDLLALGSKYTTEPAWAIPPGKSNKDVCGYLNFSSGTTGLPKAVMLSHHNIIAQCHQLRQVQVVEPSQRYRILAVMPLFHITGLVRFCHYSVFMNGDSIMLPAFTMDGMLQAIINYKVDELILVPPILIRIVRDSVVDKYMDQLQPIIKRWSSGSAPIAPEIIALLQKKFPNTGFRQGYGATESTACISCHPPSHYDYKYAATGGMLCANTVGKIMSLDPVPRELGVGEVGELWAKGPQIAMGYMNNEKATKESFDDEGFLHTGDIGHIDSDGLIRIEDRIKEMIKVKGQQVAPAELEDFLLGQDAVEDCAVLGISDSYAGERPKAYIVLKDSVTPSEEVGRALMKAVQDKKVRYKWLAELEFTNSIPKSPTGKLLRRVLKASEREKGRVTGLIVKDQKERARL
ncbi:Hypothetical protein R9X50_00535900 [Acrodontium crateriforme]|uniref:Uncharacterized protein n=1 Tax=Acrodontium crateriforme TaxID=150365 RepID=A0AAQ3M6D1_9PEZI|nr:Hypothetical protein R9X50_00535900 [Acrodontium crateriforme]